MSETIETFSEREEVEMLLPWYVARTLDAGDVARVERYIADHPDMQMQLDLVRDEQAEATLSNEMLGMPAPDGLARLRQSIAAEMPASAKLAVAGQSIWDEFKSLFSAPTPRGVQWAGMAAALLLLLQAGVIGGMMTSSSPSGGGSTFEVAGGPKNTSGTVVVRFASGATASAIADILADIDGQIIAGPKAGGLFTVRVAAGDGGKVDLKAAIAKLKAAKGVVALILGGKS